MIKFERILVSYCFYGFLLSVGLAGCAVTPSGDRPLPPVREQGGSAPPDSRRSETMPQQTPAHPPAGVVSRSQAVVSLVARADQQAYGGEPDAAAASLERALRIEPANAHLWNRLAEIRLHQGQAMQAEQLAAKSNSLAANNTTLQARNWRLIAACRNARGDKTGASAALRHANSLE